MYCQAFCSFHCLPSRINQLHFSQFSPSFSSEVFSYKRLYTDYQDPAIFLQHETRGIMNGKSDVYLLFGEMHFILVKSSRFFFIFFCCNPIRQISHLDTVSNSNHRAFRRSTEYNVMAGSKTREKSPRRAAHRGSLYSSAVTGPNSD